MIKTVDGKAYLTSRSNLWYNSDREQPEKRNGDDSMAKRDDRKRNDDKLQKAIIRNWIICGVSGAAIIILMLFSR